jgi:hypothetical protein
LINLGILLFEGVTGKEEYRKQTRIRGFVGENIASKSSSRITTQPHQARPLMKLGRGDRGRGWTVETELNWFKV